jgi:hypothetical protein
MIESRGKGTEGFAVRVCCILLNLFQGHAVSEKGGGMDYLTIKTPKLNVVFTGV